MLTRLPLNSPVAVTFVPVIAFGVPEPITVSSINPLLILTAFRVARLSTVRLLVTFKSSVSIKLITKLGKFSVPITSTLLKYDVPPAALASTLPVTLPNKSPCTLPVRSVVNILLKASKIFVESKPNMSPIKSPLATPVNVPSTSPTTLPLNVAGIVVPFPASRILVAAFDAYISPIKLPVMLPLTSPIMLFTVNEPATSTLLKNDVPIVVLTLPSTSPKNLSLSASTSRFELALNTSPYTEPSTIPFTEPVTLPSKSPINLLLAVTIVPAIGAAPLAPCPILTLFIVPPLIATLASVDKPTTLRVLFTLMSLIARFEKLRLPVNDADPSTVRLEIVDVLIVATSALIMLKSDTPALVTSPVKSPITLPVTLPVTFPVKPPITSAFTCPVNASTMTVLLSCEITLPVTLPSTLPVIVPVASTLLNLTNADSASNLP